MKKLVLAGLAAVVISLIHASIVNAGLITTYTDRTLFNAAVGATTLEDFTSSFHFPIPGGSLDSTSNFSPSTGTPINPGDIQAGVVYTTPVGTGNYFNIDLGGGFAGGMLDTVNTNALTMTYNPLVSAFGFDTNSLIGDSFTIDINFQAGSNYTNVFSAGSMQFYGFASTLSDIQSVVIQGTGFGFIIDNHAFGGATAPIPEPTTIALLGIGLAGLAGAEVRRRRKKKAVDKS